jgi:hypothetical protein
MPNGQSLIGTAGTMTLGVAQGLADTHTSMQEYLTHLERRKAHLEGLLRDSKQADVRAMIAEVDAAIAALKQAMAHVQDGSGRAKAIEARL